MAASLVSLSSSPLTRNPATCPSLSSPFKGSVKSLESKPWHLQSLKIQQISKGGRPFVVLNQVASAAPLFTATPSSVRFRLNNLGPQPGARKKAKRKGRGHSAGQGGSCGFGMRGQKSRSGPGIRKGFEGGTMPLYRRLPKLKGIAGGMRKGLPKYVHVNLRDIDARFQEGEEVSLETLKEKGVLNPSGRDRSLPLKILGEGGLSKKLSIKARAFSTQAKEKLESVGCSLSVLPGRKKWVKPSVAKNLARAEEYFAKKRAAAAASEPAST